MERGEFYHDHWVEIEQERLARYEQMFVFRPQQEALIEPLLLKAGLAVADYGCGPGFMAMEFARRVGSTGQVYGFDINKQFVSRAAARAVEAGLDHLAFVHFDGDRIELADNRLDRLFCKNVLEYVPDLSATLSEQFRVLKPGGLIEIIDSDWGFVIVEPWGDSNTRKFFSAAAPAFKEPNIGRRLYGALAHAGFDNVRLSISSMVDTVGGSISVIKNMASYIREFDSLPEAELVGLLKQLDDAIRQQTFLFVLPQFVLTATKPE